MVSNLIIREKALFKNLNSTLTKLMASLREHIKDKNHINKIHFVIEEILVNIISYSFTESEVGYFEVSLNMDSPNKIMVKIIDNGIFFNLIKKEDADISLPLIRRGTGGLGIHLLKRFVDEIYYQRINNKNILTLTFSNISNKCLI
jgi:serine/threonine-protein kinase RsbW